MFRISHSSAPLLLGADNTLIGAVNEGCLHMADDLHGANAVSS